MDRRMMLSIGCACKPLLSAYTTAVADTAARGLGGPDNMAQISRASTIARGFFVSARSGSFCGGPGGEGFGPAGSMFRSANPISVHHPRLAAGAVGTTPQHGGRIMRHALARPEQTRTQHIFSSAAGRDAAALWLERPVMSLADWRDNRFTAHACGMGFTDMAQRREAFNAAFERAIADAIVAVFVVEVAHG